MTETREIPLTRGYVAIVDAADYDWLMQWKWHWRRGYACRTRSRRDTGSIAIYMHRMILNPLPKFEVDHINNNKLDNRRSNLRVCTNIQNHQNTPKQKNNISGYKGVYFNKRTGKWAASIRVRGKTIWLGYFNSVTSAALSYDTAALRYFGEFARTNFERAPVRGGERAIGED